MTFWEFDEYVGASGIAPVSEWYNGLSPKNRAMADKFIHIARQLEHIQKPYFKTFRDLLEARWSGENKVPHRIFCYISADRHVTFLCGCTHKDKRYKPPGAYKTALRRRKEIEEGSVTTRELDF